MAEVVLIIIGAVVLIAGFIIPAGNEITGASKETLEKNVHDAVRRSVEDSSIEIKDRISDEMDKAIEKSDDQLDRITNEKMSAISEYTVTVLDDIKKNHDEVMFMYEMLNDKQKDIKKTASKTKARIEKNEVSKSLPVRKKKDVGQRGYSLSYKTLVNEDAFEKNELSDNDALIENDKSAEENNTVGFKTIEADVLPAENRHIIGNESSDHRQNAAIASRTVSSEKKTEVNASILEMHKKGISDIDIARKLKMGVGEVALIIDITKDKQEQVSDET